jgi:hypothetical protein
MARRELMRSMTLKATDFDQVVQTLVMQEEIETVSIETKTKPAHGYRLLSDEETVNESVSEVTDPSDGSGSKASH